MRRTVIMRSAFSGVMWAVIAIVLIKIASGPAADSVAGTAWRLGGGILAASLIGIAVGLCWRLFCHVGFGTRAAIALVTLYLAAFLFMLAAGLGAFVAGDIRQTSVMTVIFNSWNAAIAGLTWTGFVLILGPLAFFNHLWISRLAADPREQEATAG